MSGATDQIDEKRLAQLAEELGRAVEAAGLVRDRGDGAVRGLAFLLRELSTEELGRIFPQVDFQIYLSSEGIDLLERVALMAEEIGRLRELAVTDTLTGLFNVRYFQDRLRVEMQRVDRSETPCSLVMMDLDRFKEVNDAHGHPAGDRLLKDVADIIRANVRAVDVPFRYGGDEFGVILPDTPVLQAARLAERIRFQMETDSRTGQYGVTASLGLASHHHYDHEPCENWLSRADQALYQAKNLGGNQLWVPESERIREASTEVTVAERSSLFSSFSGEK